MTIENFVHFLDTIGARKDFSRGELKDIVMEADDTKKNGVIPTMKLEKLMTCDIAPWCIEGIKMCH